MIRRSPIWGLLPAAALLLGLVAPALADAPEDHAAALAAAESQGKPILMDFFTEW